MASGVNFGTQQYFGFDPRTIPGCALWLDGADSTTLTTSGGGNVTQWRDKSGNGSTMTPVGTQSNATIQTNYQNGLSAVNFSGINVYRTVDGTGVYPSDVYILVALKTLTRMDVIAIGTTTGGGNFNSLTFGEHTALRWHNGSDFFNRTPLMVSPTNETSTSLLLMNWSLSNNNFVIRRNGTQLVTTASYTYTLTAPSSIQLGFRHTELTSTTLPFDAYVAEVLTFNRQLELAERQQVEGYLAWKWALTSNLPSTHPFRRAPLFMRSFQPVDVSGGTALWLDAADATTLSLSGSSVTQWRDKSGLGVTFTTVNANPTRTASLINGLPGLDLTNASGFISSTTQNLTANLTLAMILVVKSGIGAWGSFFTHGSRDLDFAMERNSISTGTTLQFQTANDNSGANLTFTTDQVALYLGTMTTGTSRFFSRFGGGTTTTATGTNSSTITVGLQTIRIGRSDVGENCNSLIGEIVYFNRVLSTTERQQIEGYLTWKWGVQGSLPTTHPYYRVLPSTPLFSPDQLSGLVLWLDAADSTTLYSDTAGTTLATLGGSVARWNDKSASSNYVSQGTAGNRPTLSNFPSSTEYRGIYFPGTSTNLTSISNNTQSGNVSRTMFFILNVPNTSSRFTAGTGSHTGGTPPVAFGIDNVPSIPTLWAPYVYTAADNAFSVQLTGTMCVYAYYNGSASQLGGGYNFATFNTQSTTLNTTASPWYFGTRPDGEGSATSYVSEVILYNTALTTFQRHEVEGYLAWKWGLQTSLPSTHPFAKFRP